MTTNETSICPQRHTIHIFVPLEDPLDLPNGYSVQYRESPGAYEGRRLVPFMSYDVPSLPEMMAGTMCRFFRRTIPLDPTRFIESITQLPFAIWPSLQREPGNEPQGESASTDPYKIHETAVEIIHVVGCRDEECDGLSIGREHLENTFRLGLWIIRAVQRSVYFATRQHYTLATEQAAPFILPFTVGTILNGEFIPPTQPQIWQVNENFLPFVPPHELADDDLKTVNSLVPEAYSRIFMSYLDFIREAAVAFYRRGDSRTAAIMVGLACERLFDDLLACLLWESCVRPEDAPSYFADRSGILARVRREFHVRIGGNWDTTNSANIAGQWNHSVAMLRNRVAHADYWPADAEITESLRVAVDLVSYISEILAGNVLSGRWARTALLLIGEPGLASRNAFTRRAKQAAAELNENKNWEKVARWVAAASRARERDWQEADPPKSDRSYAMCVVMPDGMAYCIQHDREVAMARTISAAASLSSEQIASLALLRQQLSEDARFDVPITVRLNNIDLPRDWGPWVEEYRLVPGASVMANGADIDEADYALGTLNLDSPTA